MMVDGTPSSIERETRNERGNMLFSYEKMAHTENMLIPVWLQTPYGYGESPNGKFFVSLPLSIRGSPYGNGETKWLIILIW